MATVEGPLPAPSGWRVWWLAARPRTLALAVAPVLLGTVIAHAHDAARALPALAALAGALLLQVGANFANDVFDAEHGADTTERIGPPRATQMGWLAPAQVKRATLLVFAASALVGAYLVAIGGWPIAVLGLLAIAAGFAYTGGPLPLGYLGLGDVAVFLFFGLAAVCGTYYVQAGALPGVVIAASLPAGALATAVLVVNNARDIDADRAAGKRTLAVRFGRGAARAEYTVLLALAYAVPAALALGGRAPLAVLLTALSLPLALLLARNVTYLEDGPSLNTALAGTARLALVHAALFAVGWML